MQFRTKIESYDEWELTFAEHELFRHLYHRDGVNAKWNGAAGQLYMQSTNDADKQDLHQCLQGKIAAIKYLKQRDGLDLRRAKDRVDSMWDSLKNA